jgi:tetratricopeptide (TPR) repeat protein
MRSVLRLIGFFFAVFVALRLVQMLPVVGRFFHGFVGFWLAALGLAWLLSVATERLLARRRLNLQIYALGHVDNPHIRGKRGALLLAAGRAARALPDLEAAVAGEPEVVEWRYRLGLARLALGQAREAAQALDVAETLAPDHAYGGIQLALARAELARGETGRALDALRRFELARGDTPESAYLRGKLHAKSGRRAEAAPCFAAVEALFAHTPKFQRRAQAAWVWRSRLARLGLVL